MSQAEPETESRTLSFLEAIGDGLAGEMRRDPTVFALGEDIAAGVYGFSAGLVDEFGRDRVRDTPISEPGFVGMAVGAAMAGMRPFVDLNIATFIYVAMDQLVNQAAKNRFLFGGQTKVPMVIHLISFHRSHVAAQHGDRPHPLLMNVPGWKIVAPSTPYDAKGLTISAIRDDDPVILFEDVGSWNQRGAVPVEPYTVPIGRAHVAREGRDVTVVAFFSLGEALAAADDLAKSGIDAEVIDPRSLAPLDEKTILESVVRTGRLVAVDTAHITCSAASEIAATAAEKVFDSLKAPIRRVCMPNVHIPFSKPLEQHVMINKDKIIDAIKSVVAI